MRMLRGGGVAALAAYLLMAPAPPGTAQDEQLCLGQPAIVLTDGDDDYVGTSGPDVVWSGAGDDSIRGMGGDDAICAGSGADTIHGGGDYDFIIGGRPRLPDR